MGYRDDLYKADNIIGWTGKLHAEPTVYFRCVSPDGKQMFGHIAQTNPTPANIGRGRVFTTNRDTFGGQYFERVVSFVEANGDQGKVDARIGFNPISAATQQDMSILTSSIRKFAELKGYDAVSKGGKDSARKSNPAHTGAVKRSREVFESATRVA